MIFPASGPCPCGRSDAAGRTLSYAQCCGRYLDARETSLAPDAESLMRSRYSAFVQQRSDYLLATWHPATRPQEIAFEPGVKWLGLAVKACHVSDASHAEVEFVARQRERSGRALRLHERSRFVREADRWFYVDGDQF